MMLLLKLNWSRSALLVLVTISQHLLQFSSGEEESTKVSEAIDRLLKMTTTLQDVEKTVHRLVTSGDPFIELIDTRLDPMNDELARIKIYLDVKQGQLGDPASIQKRIEALIPQIREIEEQYGDVVRKMEKEYTDLMTKFESILYNWVKGLKTDGHLLKQIRFKLPKMNADSGPPPYQGKFQLREIVPILEELVLLFMNLEAEEDKLTEGEEIPKDFVVAEKTSQDFIQEHTSYLQSAGPVIAGSFHDISRNITLINPTFITQKEKYEKEMQKFDSELYAAEKQFDKVTGGNTFNVHKREAALKAKMNPHLHTEL